MITQSINYNELISPSTTATINLNANTNPSKNAPELYEVQDDVGDYIAGNIVGKIVGQGATQAVGAMIGGEVGQIAGPLGVIIGAATGYVVGKLMEENPHEKLPEPKNPNHFYAMGTGIGIGDDSNKTSNCYSSYYVNSYTCS